MKIVSFNVRCSWDSDGINSFKHRGKFVVLKINREKPDVVAFQEVTDKILEYLKRNLRDYEFLGHGRDKDFKGEGVYLAVRRKTVDILGLDIFWMTDNPYVPGSRLEGQSHCPRTCIRSLLKFEDKMFRVYNLHLDHPGNAGKIRTREMEIVFDDIENERKKLDVPTFILGDFNDLPDSECINLINKMNYVDLCADSGHTFHNFKGDDYDKKSKIDYIFCDEKTSKKCRKTEKWTDFFIRIYLSDHYPLSAELKL